MASKKLKAPVNIPTEKIHSFEGHPYKVLDNEEMELLTVSIKEQGILSPIIVRLNNSSAFEKIRGTASSHI